MRETLPARRRSWTQHVHIAGQSVYMTVGEYADGRPGEIFIDMSRQGTLLRGVMGSLARMVSISLQCGAGVDVVVHALRGIAYPPDGPVEGSMSVSECMSVTDWIASELEAHYMRPAIGGTEESEVSEAPSTEQEEWRGDAMPEKVAGYKAEAWRSGV